MNVQRWMLSLLLSIVLFGSIGSAASALDHPPNNTIKELLQRKVARLREVYDATKLAFPMEEASFQSLVQAQMDYLLGTLELAETHKQRLAVHQELVTAARKLRDNAEQLFQAKGLSRQDFLRTEVVLLDREIALAREKQVGP